MSDRLLARAVVAALAVFAVQSLGCSPTAPDHGQALIAAVTTPSVATIAPLEGLAGVANSVTITGVRFQDGLSVTIDGAAVVVRVLNGTTIFAWTPVHPSAGIVDVVVTNPNGEAGRLTAGFRYSRATLTAGATSVAPGATLSVSWVAPGRSQPNINGDWIGLFRVGDENTASIWSLPTTGVSGTFNLNAPLQPGEYEFRYLVDDDYIDVARSALVTVGASSTRIR